MAINFPSAPILGQTVPVGNKVYAWNGTAWEIPTSPPGGGGGGGGASVTTDDVAPSIPKDGDMWLKTTTGVLYVYYDDGNSKQWVQVSASPQTVGAALASPFKRTVITASTNTFQYDPSSLSAEVECQGPGGGGSGTLGSSGVGTASIGAGGGEGGWCKKIIILTPAIRAATKTIVIGAGGTSSAGSAGGTGGVTSYTDGTNTLTANGGFGGSSSGGYSASLPTAQGGGGGVATGGDVNRTGGRGLDSFGAGASTVGVASAASAVCGHGADSRYGAGGAGGIIGATTVGTTSQGSDAGGYGAGGGGGAACGSVGSNQPGGLGSPGIMIITEYR